MYNKHVLVSHLTAFYMQSFRLSPPLISFAHGFEKPFILHVVLKYNLLQIMVFK